MFPLNSIFFHIQSMAILESVADSGSPCFYPCLNIKFSSEFIVYFYRCACSESVNVINFINLDGILYSFRLSFTLFLLIESKVCRQWTNILWISILYSWHFSNVWHTINILSNVDLFGLNPTWASLSLESTIFDSLLFRRIVNILYAMLSNVIGL